MGHVLDGLQVHDRRRNWKITPQLYLTHRSQNGKYYGKIDQNTRTTLSKWVNRLHTEHGSVTSGRQRQLPGILIVTQPRCTFLDESILMR